MENETAGDKTLIIMVNDEEVKRETVTFVGRTVNAGRILQGIGSFYTVESGEACYVCKARGRFRKQRITPWSAIWWSLRLLTAESEGSIEEILPRSSGIDPPADG